MQDLINQIMSKTGISSDQASGALETVKNYITEKFPAIGSTLSSFFEGGHGSTPTAASTDTPATAGGEGIMDKATDFIKEHGGDIKGKAEEIIEELGDKMKNMFK